MHHPTPLPCRLLSLPAELRDYIYILAFAKTTVVAIADLLHPKPPNKAVILACKQLHAEARELYRTAYREYWNATDFFLYLDAEVSTERQQAMRSMILHHEKDLPHIKSLHVCLPKSYSCDLVDKHGGWKVVVPDGRERYIRVRRSHHRDGPDQPSIADLTRLAWDGHANEAELREACFKYPSRVPLVDQILLLPTLRGLDVR